MRRAAFRLAAWQLALTLVIAAAAGLLGGQRGSISALAGGSIGILAGLYQALRMFSAGDEPIRFMRAVYVSEVLKILLTAALFIAAIRVLQPRFVPMIAAYSATFLVYWAALGTGYPWPGAQPGQRRGRNNGS
jgi:ATP synthase protein I